ncbi:hypothetical protein LguiA_016210 [Lonicera macranthoides]
MEQHNLPSAAAEVGEQPYLRHQRCLAEEQKGCRGSRIPPAIPSSGGDLLSETFFFLVYFRRKK